MDGSSFAAKETICDSVCHIRFANVVVVNRYLHVEAEYADEACQLLVLAALNDHILFWLHTGKLGLLGTTEAMAITY